MIGLVERLEPADLREPGIVEECVDPAEPVRGRADERLDRYLGFDIERPFRVRVTTGTGDLPAGSRKSPAVAAPMPPVAPVMTITSILGTPLG